MNTVILYIAMSLDGFIADEDGGVDWLPHPKDSEELEIVGYNQLMKRVQVIIMGSRSYEQIKAFGSWAWPDKNTYVFTSKKLESNLPCIEFVDESPKEFFKKHKIAGAIWLLGGAKLAKSFAEEGFIDEVVLTVVPKTLERGIALDLPLEDFEFLSERNCMPGIVQRTYRKWVKT